jgi:hypothetical protein
MKDKFLLVVAASEQRRNKKENNKTTNKKTQKSFQWKTHAFSDVMLQGFQHCGKCVVLETKMTEQ